MIDLEKLERAAKAAEDAAVEEFEEREPDWHRGGAATPHVAYEDFKWTLKLLYLGP